ncbi:MAG: hypothetical protein ACAI43_21540 [Phycisphaerae bacterium]|nr:hypothetical protein [Tepidisphaeraceae bacterium]
MASNTAQLGYQTPGAPDATTAAVTPPDQRTSLRRPGFWVVAGILLVGAVGLNAATAVMKLYFKKEPLPLRSAEGLLALPREMGSWVMVPESHTVDADLVQALGTDRYVFRKYVDTSAKKKNGQPVATREDVIGLKDLSPKDRAARLNQWSIDNPGSWIELAVTYYTGKVDTVPHVPERCMVAAGWLDVYSNVFDWRFAGPEAAAGTAASAASSSGAASLPAGERVVPVRFIDFQSTDGKQQLRSRFVTYFFHANGQYMQDVNQVRSTLQRLDTKYGYFAKVELMVPLATPAKESADGKDADRAVAMETTRRFLSASVLEVERLLPDFEKYRR